MQASKSSRIKAMRIVRQQAVLERKGVRAAASIGARAQAAFFRNLTTSAKIAPLTAFKNEMMKGVDTLAGAMITSHLAAMRMVVKSVPEKHRLRLSSVFDAATIALQTQLGITDAAVVAMTAYYVADAQTILARTSLLATRKLQKTMLTIQTQGLHVAGGKKLLADTFALLKLTPSNSYTLENIYRTQIQTAYSAGRWNMNRDPAIQEILWGYEYVTVGDTRVRPKHRGMEGTKLPKNNPWWKVNFPPNGFSCRCQAIEIFDSPDDLGGEQAPPSTFTTTQNGKSVTVVPGADDGFRFNPGEVFGVTL